MHGNGSATLRTRFFSTLAVLALAAFAGCGGSGYNPPTPPVPPDPPVTPAPPDLTGVWAGTWEGNEPGYGRVSGNWEAEIAMTYASADGNAYQFSGPVRLSGDIDCADGDLTFFVYPSDNQVYGQINRPPCNFNSWHLTALDTGAETAAGLWTQNSTTSTGSFAGRRIAGQYGPRILYFHPAGGPPGTLVTVTAAGLGDSDLLGFGASGQANLPPLANDGESLLIPVPAGAQNGSILLGSGESIVESAVPFRTDVSSPAESADFSIDLGQFQQAVAVSPDGRRAYVAVLGNPACDVAYIDTSTGYNLLCADIAFAGDGITGIAAHPGGRTLYAVSRKGLVIALHAIDGKVRYSLPLNWPVEAAGEAYGVAITPSGRHLLAAEGWDGGGVSVLDLKDGSVISLPGPGAGFIPRGVAADPDGRRLYATYAASSGAGGELAVYDRAAATLLARVPLGHGPAGAAVKPDGRVVYAANAGDHSLSVVSTGSPYEVLATVSLTGTTPSSVAVSPDGLHVYVANTGSDTLDVVDTVTRIPNPEPVGTQALPVAVAVSPEGKRAYVAHGGSTFLAELGNAASLTVIKTGGGLGRVRSAPGGIDCGGQCRSEFDQGAVVDLTALPEIGSTFRGWGGDCSACTGSNCTVTLNGRLSCTAAFEVTSGGGSGGGGGGGGGGGCFLQILDGSSPGDRSTPRP